MQTTTPRFMFFLAISLLLFAYQAKSQPQTNLLNIGCSQYNATNPTVFFENLNATFNDLRVQLGSTHFATANQTRGSDPVYAMAQCRDYLSTSDCLLCYDTAESQIRNCSIGNGARVIYDGCFLRYESSVFSDQMTLPGNLARCGNRTASNPTGFDLAVNGLLADLVAVTPRINGYYAATTREGVGGVATVYGVAQCALTATETACASCLSVAMTNMAGCLPDTEARGIDAGCFLRYSNTAFFSANQSMDLTPYLRTGGGSSSKKGAIIGGVAGGAGFGLLLVLLFLWVRRSKKLKAKRGDILGATELRGPMTFRYKDLKTATGNFSEKNKLGEGGFGEVYKGLLKNGKTVAVKKIMIGQSKQAKENFASEVRLISNVHHRYLIRLLGCCSRGSELVLVYEYMANSSLDKFLFGESITNLNWKQRFDIIVGMARGLAYLHEEFHVCIIHRDIKSSNILLDEDFQPKIADFGLARLLPEDQSHLTTKFAGTLGYTAPEYAIRGQLSEKVDTYSYGVVALEIISGRKSNDIKLEAVNQYLLEYAWRLYETDRLIDLVDERLDPNEYKIDEVMKVIEIALLCTQSTVASRPTMSEVVVFLLSSGETMQKPTRPTFIDATNKIHGDETTTIITTAASNATVSISQASGR